MKVKFTMPKDSGLKADFNMDKTKTIALKSELNAEIEARIEGDNNLQSEIARVENEIPDISNLATKTELQEVENEIPVVNNGTLTIIQNGETKGVFSANDSNNVIVNLEAGGSSIWGSIQGTLSDQTDLQNALNDLSGGIGSNHQAIGEINTIISGYGNIVTYNASDFATSSQGQLADTALQSGADISQLNNDVGYITSVAISSLTDVDITNLSNGQGLLYNSTTQKWENQTIQSGGGTWGSITGTLSDQTDLQQALNQKQDTLTFSTGLTDTSGTITVTDYAKLIKNTATREQSLTINGTASTQNQSINIGTNSVVSSNLCVALGFDAQATKSSAVTVGYGGRATGTGSSAYGYFAKATGNYAIQLGNGTNSTASTLAVGFNGTNYQLLDGTTGKIPNARLNSLVGADGTNAGTAGIVPAPTATDNTKFLRGDGTWATAGGGIVDQTYDATSTNAQSGTAVAGAISTKQNTLIAGDDIHFTTTIGLPAGYTEVVSVTNAATTYVNTGVRLTADNAVMEIHFSLTDASGSFYLWQQRSSTSGNILGLSGSATGSTISMNVGGTAITSDIARTAGHTYFVRATYNSGNGTLYVKDETTGTEATNTGTYTWGLVNKDLHMFGNGLNTSQVSNAGITVDYASLTVNGKKTFDACFAKNSSDVVGIYNTIGRTFGTAGVGSLTAGADSDKPRDVIYASGFLKNTATNTGSGTITIGGTPSANTQALNVGGNSSTGSAYTVAVGHTASATGQYSTAVGRSASGAGTGGSAFGSTASAAGAYSTALGYGTSANYGATAVGYGSTCTNNGLAIGYQAKTTTDYAIQIGKGTNATASTLAIGFNGTNYELLDGTTGKIPDARISTNIARTADLAAEVSTDLLTIGNTSINESQLQALLALI